jgi:hypothetical protein
LLPLALDDDIFGERQKPTCSTEPAYVEEFRQHFLEIQRKLDTVMKQLGDTETKLLAQAQIFDKIYPLSANLLILQEYYNVYSKVALQFQFNKTEEVFICAKVFFLIIYLI